MGGATATESLCLGRRTCTASVVCRTRAAVRVRCALVHITSSSSRYECETWLDYRYRLLVRARHGPQHRVVAARQAPSLSPCALPSCCFCCCCRCHSVFIASSNIDVLAPLICTSSTHTATILLNQGIMPSPACAYRNQLATRLRSSTCTIVFQMLTCVFDIVLQPSRSLLRQRLGTHRIEIHRWVPASTSSL